MVHKTKRFASLRRPHLLFVSFLPPFYYIVHSVGVQAASNTMETKLQYNISIFSINYIIDIFFGSFG